MSASSLHRRIMAEETGAWSMPLRAGLRLASRAYGAAVSLRNGWYDRRGARVTLPIPVISVGNITVGGTGKSPLVMDIVRRLDRMGRSPAVISRGYGGERGAANDEERLIRQRCPGVITVSAGDRAWAAETARRDCGADVIVLDDGFQHRRLHRELDIVLIDATCPFGYDHLLPRGLLREPVASLRRAHLIALTRCDQASPAELERIEARIRRAVGDPCLVRCRHLVTAIDDLDGVAIAGEIEGMRAVLFAGIGNPDSFRTTVRALGVDVVAHQWWSDHHRYTPREIRTLLRRGRFPAHDLLLTTEKDAVKLLHLRGIERRRIGVVKIAIDFEGGGGTIVQSALERALHSAGAPPVRRSPAGSADDRSCSAGPARGA